MLNAQKRNGNFKQGINNHTDVETVRRSSYLRRRPQPESVRIIKEKHNIAISSAIELIETTGECPATSLFLYDQKGDTIFHLSSNSNDFCSEQEILQKVAKASFAVGIYRDETYRKSLRICISSVSRLSDFTSILNVEYAGEQLQLHKIIHGVKNYAGNPLGELRQLLTDVPNETYFK